MVGIGIERWHGHMRHHDSIDSRSNAFPKRRQFDRIEMRPINRNFRDAEM